MTRARRGAPCATCAPGACTCTPTGIPLLRLDDQDVVDALDAVDPRGNFLRALLHAFRGDEPRELRDAVGRLDVDLHALDVGRVHQGSLDATCRQAVVELGA